MANEAGAELQSGGHDVHGELADRFAADVANQFAGTMTKESKVSLG